MDGSDKTALAIAGIGAVGTGFSILAGAPTWTLQTFASAVVAGITYFMSHQTRIQA